MASTNNGMRVEVRVNGLADIQAKLLTLSKDRALRLIRGAMKDGAEVVRLEAVKGVVSQGSVRTGALARSIIIRSGRANGPHKLSGFEEWAGVTIARTVYEAALDEGKLVPIARGAKAPSGAIRPRSYAHLIEFGVRPHATGKGSRLDEVVKVTRPGRRGRTATRTVKTGREGKQLGRGHPGVAPRPFMRPAYHTRQAEAHQAIVQGARRRLDDILAAMRRAKGAP